MFAGYFSIINEMNNLRTRFLLLKAFKEKYCSFFTDIDVKQEKLCSYFGE